MRQGRSWPGEGGSAHELGALKGDPCGGTSGCSAGSHHPRARLRDPRGQLLPGRPLQPRTNPAPHAWLQTPRALPPHTRSHGLRSSLHAPQRCMPSAPTPGCRPPPVPALPPARPSALHRHPCAPHVPSGRPTVSAPLNSNGNNRCAIFKIRNLFPAALSNSLLARPRVWYEGCVCAREYTWIQEGGNGLMIFVGRTLDSSIA